MNDTTLTVLGILFIFVMTTLGAALVFFFKKDINPKLNTLFLGFASGIMIAASVWSLLIPSIDAADESGLYEGFSWLPALVGFLVGGLFLMLLDKVVPHMHESTNKEEGPHTSFRKSTKMFLAVTIHNIPEGLAVGFAFGAAAAGGEHAAFLAAMGLALGIGIQNFPEGAAVALPMRNASGSRSKAFLYGMGSGAVEPIFALIGYFLAAYVAVLQPWLLAFAAGAMIFVVAEDLIPDSKLQDNPHMGTWGVMAGFAVMMVLDVALG
jgi:ZIP family zinc transporter